MNEMKVKCSLYGLLPDCKNCTTELSNQYIGEDRLLKECFKPQLII